jgi:hypothetical protein
VATADEITQALNFAQAEKMRREVEASLKAKRDAELRAKWLAKFGTWLTPTEGNSCGGGKLAAKNIRKQLKKAFPGVKFSVISDYSSVDVRWEFGPTAKAVDAIIDSARINANDTVRDERLPLSDWDYMFTATIGSQLSTGQYNRHVVAFFTTRGITY